MSLSKKELLELKEKVEDSKTAASELKGQQTVLLKQLKDEFACASIEEAEEKLEEINKNIASIDKRIKKGTEELEKQFEEEEEDDN